MTPFRSPVSSPPPGSPSPYAPPPHTGTARSGTPFGPETGQQQPQDPFGGYGSQQPQPFGAAHPGQAPGGPGQQFPGRPPAAPTNGLAVAALVVGIIALLIAWVPVVNVVAIIGGLVAVVLGAVAIGKVRKNHAGGKGLAVAGVVMGTVSVVAAVLVNVALGAFVSEVDKVMQEQASAAGVDQEPAEDAAAGSGTDVAGDAAAADDEEAAPATDPAGDLLALGESAEVGEYTVTVKGLNLQANEAIAAANPFNEPPSGQYVLADVSVVYNGTEEGDPWIDLSHTFAGSDARQYDSSSCMAVEPAPIMDVPTLNTGGAADYQVCMDVPAEAIEGGEFFVEETFSFSDTRVTWNIR